MSVAAEVEEPAFEQLGVARAPASGRFFRKAPNDGPVLIDDVQGLPKMISSALKVAKASDRQIKRITLSQSTFFIHGVYFLLGGDTGGLAIPWAVYSAFDFFGGERAKSWK